MDDLIARFVAGDEAAVRAVVQQYSGAVRTIARSMVAEPELVSDVVQQTFIKAWKASSSFDPQRELAPWLYSIARRTAIDVLRKERRPTMSDHEPEVDVSVTPLSFERTWERFEVRRALDQLSPDEREVIRLSHLMGVPHAEIADRLGLPLGTVKSRSNRAMRRLAAALGHLAESGQSDDSEIQTPVSPVQATEETT